MTIAGEIVDGKAGPGRAGGETIARAIEKGLAKKDLKALVVRVDSPGGSALASERIRQALLAAKAKKIPVVVSMGNVAASGGYWVVDLRRLCLRRAFDHHRFDRRVRRLPSFEGTLAKLGVGADGIKTTPMSGEPDLLKGPSPEADALIQAGVEQVYRKFLGIVAERGTSRRRMSTGSPRAESGTAAPPASSGWSTGSAAWTRRSPRRPNWPSSARTSAG